MDDGAAQALTFYRDPDLVVAEHFRTSSHVGGPFTRKICSLLTEADLLLGHPSQLDFVDVGAGDGQLLSGVLGLRGDYEWGDRLRCLGVDLRARPSGLDPLIEWAISDVPSRVTGLLTGIELLDECLAPDAVSRDLVARVHGIALFVDYANAAPVAVYRGRSVPAVPDGSANVSRGVPFELCAARVADLGEVSLQSQSEALTGSVVDLPGIAGLAERSALTELTDPRGLGSHEWLMVRTV